LRFVCLLGVIVVNFGAVPILSLSGAALTVGAPVIVIAADARKVVRDARGDQIGWLHTQMSSLSYSTDEGYFKALFDAGAWAVVDARALSKFCGAGHVS